MALSFGSNLLKPNADVAPSPRDLKSPAVPEAEISFTRHKFELPTFGVLIGIGVVELLAVHMLVALWSSSAAWVLSALTVLALGHIALLAHGMMKWPTLVDGTGVTVRHGRRGEIFVPMELIASVEDVALRPEEKGPGTFRATELAHPNVAIRLSAPLAYRKRSLSCITMRLDDPAAFQVELRSRLTATA